MQFGIRVNTSPFARFVSNLEAQLNPAHPGPMQEGLLAASDVYMESERLRYAEASHGDGTWQELADSTIKAREEEGETPPMPILHKTGDMEASMGRGHPNHVLEITDSGIIEGTADPKARFHQDGSERMPARPILVAPTGDTLAAMKEKIVTGLQDAVTAAAPNKDLGSLSKSDLGAVFGIEII